MHIRFTENEIQHHISRFLVNSNTFFIICFLRNLLHHYSERGLKSTIVNRTFQINHQTRFVDHVNRLQKILNYRTIFENKTFHFLNEVDRQTYFLNL